MAARLAELPEFRDADRLALYSALSDELSMAFVAARAEADGKAIVWPRIQSGVMDFAEAQASDLVPGAMGILEPGADAITADLGSCPLIVIPGRGFDRQGERLGRGKGYYDRAVAGRGDALVVGVGFSCQLVDRLPAEPHDQRMDVVLTERESLRCPVA